MYLISFHKKGISSCQLARNIAVTRKTAWYVLHKVRNLFPQDDFEQFSCQVELNEVYIGGKKTWKHKSMRTPHIQGRSTLTKTPIFGLIEHSSIINDKGEEEFMSYVHAFVVYRTDGDTLIPYVEQFVEVGSTVYTNVLISYRPLTSKGYEHHICKPMSMRLALGGTQEK